MMKLIICHCFDLHVYGGVGFLVCLLLHVCIFDADTIFSWYIFIACFWSVGL
uniref:Uncharacterized protein n=1 Tax=Anguilla anguilla TaxID=7936 RepID=A0A0E9W811_ANGAN